MKINNINNGLINAAGNQPKNAFTPKSPVTATGALETSELTGKSGVTSAGALNSTDRTTLSSTTVSSLVSQAMQTPSVRQEKVNALKEAVSSGSYVIDSTKIAGAIADEAGS